MMRSGSHFSNIAWSRRYKLLPLCAVAVTCRSMSRLVSVLVSGVLRVITGMVAPGGNSHSCVTATRWSRSPSATRMSVAPGTSEQILMCHLTAMRSSIRRSLSRLGEGELSLSLLQPVRHPKLAVHHRGGREMFAGVAMLVRGAPVARALRFFSALHRRLCQERNPSDDVFFNL